MNIEKTDDLVNASDDVKMLNPEVFGMQASATSGPATGGKYHVAPPAERTYHGVLYQSKKERLFAVELDLRVRAGEITYWLRQVPFPLPGGDRYVADFVTFKRFWDENFPKASLQLWRGYER